MITLYAGKRALVTGGTGSFGQTVVRRMLATDIAEVRVLSRDEAKHDLMRQDLGDSRVRFYVGDIRDYLSVERASRDVDLVFHAAALKQVPSCEFFPMEAVRTNIVGSDNVVRACEANSVRSLVFLSTDKAVYPINAMGMTKAMMEKIAQSHGLNNPNTETIVSCVRYGNVMYSRGSVIPLFIRQLKAGKRITITHPGMTRFMMSLAESVDLVEYAFTHARQGDLFIRKAAACTIADLVTALGKLFGIHPEVDVIGIRHGEKMSESLASREELARAKDHGDYFQIVADTRDLNYGLYFDEGDPEQAKLADYDSHTTVRLDVAEIERLLLTLPEVQAELAIADRLRVGAA
ncbi:MAG: polysaccharide biosynthesis protein [Pseudonocardiaceae bacterium]